MNAELESKVNFNAENSRFSGITAGPFHGLYHFLINVSDQARRMQLPEEKFQEFSSSDSSAGYFLTARSLRRFLSSDMNSWTSLKSI
jgi:hypothetical protein